MSNEYHPKPKVLFFGTPGQYSRGILVELQRIAVPVVAIVHRTAPNAPNTITMLSPRARQSPPLAGASGDQLDAIPRMLVRNLDDPDVVEQVRAFAPDFIVAGCFPLLIPRQIIELPIRAALNVHPSLLPRHRGPDPIFWTLHAGESTTGVTIHEMDDQFDTGPVLAQSHVSIAPNATYEHIERDLAIRGGALLAELLQRSDLPSAKPQLAEHASTESVPREADLEIRRDWTVDRAMRFINGCGRSHGPLWNRSAAGAMTRFRNLAAGTDGAPIGLSDGVLRVQPIT